MNHEKIPQHLKNTAEWCCLKYEQKPGKAKPDKIPKNPRTGGNASVNIPNTFSDFDTAIKAVVKFDGIGTRGSKNLALIDLDHCVENGNVAPWAQTVTDQETFDTVQRIRNGKRRITPMGEMPVLSGMVFCADCGAKLYRGRGHNLPQKEYMYVLHTERKARACVHPIRFRTKTLRN